MIKPAFLQVNDKVAITSTARKLPKSTIKNGVEVLTQLGFKAVVSDTIGAEHYIFAGNDTHRLQELQRFLDDESIKAIWLARGGYGSIRILEQLNWDNFTKHAKWLIGFSDVTNLLAKVNDLNIACIHG
ncbi:MAG: LD-carboxypeptidase, partial [Bacteroidia bacterium]